VIEHSTIDNKIEGLLLTNSASGEKCAEEKMINMLNDQQQ
jgi:hypothetical protein